MAKDKELTAEERDRMIGGDTLFAKSLEGIADEGKLYLGDPDVVATLLQDFVLEATKHNIEGEEPEAELEDLFDRMAAVFLGKRPQYFAPVPGWNEPDGEAIKKWLEKQGMPPETSAEDAVKGVLLSLYIESVGALELSAQEGIKDEQWAHIPQAEMELAANQLMGIPNESAAVVGADPDEQLAQLGEAALVRKVGQALTETQRLIMENWKDYP